ncbi:MAG: 30S ribosomal protein S4 [Candidatus Taylorbacteria bacterium RIFCSPLOWO2_12_FULL_43_20]|uniref:Small ribosomal subunit protein uS4 n=1 Tax=Candidatus Taylorbacteria bacterium RIFCSPLOWO2_12_FULL_43_20 TaxID=1802332 RepID=A0A1G2P1K3_9BACT|nr:MAG: 30S ribosomal protein S4 [Candidatus Taylorbacteria bacterium RIFCSPHIGHO2_01_FULL_43_120]OHA27947.1 MAG: 30S ribosomal protein S4 [Candidatus Taylorbacteria bacterium RIFCSPHIGHO2_12_FULL_42_34]OHA32042.1 MAG: 30S ribosomal protein S4 [Candidatus Taylorbacteria bacterium RIFCSPLOWO2_01_FULL_43_83]OHA39792.1 MAG: 30S ribosomal protein S4 [Candidatus Taylorbacteria bacterium RIFCSPLOWO2_02_FULL_43_22b]OHA41471.1 MAG: 30S ribosomal protein S4 [Candidatus Taylorbacteria bacterium RIFCSPLOW
MKIGPKYKIARRLGASIFDKTATPKFAASSAKKSKTTRPKAKSQYGTQLNEKQKARFMYGINERQFGNYVSKALAMKNRKTPDTLYEMLETRIDNVLYRAGFASTRQFGRQIVSHGHIVVNGTKVTIPSFKVSMGDVVSIREASSKKKCFANLDAVLKEMSFPKWITVDAAKREIKVVDLPVLMPSENMFDVNAIIQYYQR